MIIVTDEQKKDSWTWQLLLATAYATQETEEHCADHKYITTTYFYMTQKVNHPFSRY